MLLGCKRTKPGDVLLEFCFRYAFRSFGDYTNRIGYRNRAVLWSFIKSVQRQIHSSNVSALVQKSLFVSLYRSKLPALINIVTRSTPLEYPNKKILLSFVLNCFQKRPFQTPPVRHVETIDVSLDGSVDCAFSSVIPQISNEIVRKHFCVSE